MLFDHLHRQRRECTLWSTSCDRTSFFPESPCCLRNRCWEIDPFKDWVVGWKSFVYRWLHCCQPCHEVAMQICGFYNIICFSEHECSQTKWLYQQQNVVLKCGLSLNDSVNNKAPISGSSVSTIYKLLAKETWQIARGNVPHDLFFLRNIICCLQFSLTFYPSATKSKIDSSFHTHHILN